MLPVVAVDLGGTNLRAAYFPTGQPPAERTLRIPTHADSGPQAVLATMVEAIRDLTGPAPAPGLRVSVAAPGPLDPDSGVIFDAPNLPGWKNVPLRAHLEEKLGWVVRVGNDANLAALGEWRYGAGQGVDHLVYLTISTGIGGGVIIGGRLLTGATGLAGELGHFPVRPGGPICSCGKAGHLEAVASGTAIARRARELMQTGEKTTIQEAADSESVASAAHQGDPLARRVLNEAGEALGLALVGFVHVFNPQRIILGGGVVRSGDVFLEPARRVLRTEIMNPAFLEGLEVVTAALGDDSGLMGALVLAGMP